MGRSGQVLLSASILRSNLWRLESTLEELQRAKVNFIHLDLMDGCFAPNLGLPMEMLLSAPSESRLPVDIHLLSVAPQGIVKSLHLRPFDQISIHVEVVPKDAMPQAISALRETGARIGFALKPETSIECLKDWLRALDFVLLMGVLPGQYGMPLLPGTLTKIRHLDRMKRATNASVLVEVDGGINKHSVLKLKAAGANIIVCGSIIFNAKGIVASTRELRHLLGGAYVRRRNHD